MFSRIVILAMLIGVSSTGDALGNAAEIGQSNLQGIVFDYGKFAVAIVFAIVFYYFFYRTTVICISAELKRRTLQKDAKTITAIAKTLALSKQLSLAQLKAHFAALIKEDKGRKSIIEEFIGIVAPILKNRKDVSDERLRAWETRIQQGSKQNLLFGLSCKELGLLGTILGIMASFGQLASDPTQSLSGIAFMLITSALALVMSILINFFVARRFDPATESMKAAMRHATVELFYRFPTQKGKSDDLPLLDENRPEVKQHETEMINDANLELIELSATGDNGQC